MDSSHLELFRQRVEQFGLGGPGKRYPEELRELAISFAIEQLKFGASKLKIAAQLGIRTSTLQRWLEPDKDLEHDFLPVAMLQTKADHHDIALVSPSGWRITGLGLKQAAELVQILGC